MKKLCKNADLSAPAAVSGTIIFCILVGGYVVYNFENFMIDIYKLDLLEYAKSILIKYVVFVGVYALITYIIFSIKYSRARKNLRVYAHNLSKLSKNYNNNE